MLGQTQPTLSRQISNLEKELGVLLLERGTRGLTITDSGQDLLVHVRAMGQAASQLSLAAAGQSASVEGHVSITATNAFATFHLPRILKRLRVEAPRITLLVESSNEVRDITRREVRRTLESNEIESTTIAWLSWSSILVKKCLQCIEMCIHITHMPANQVQLSGFCMTNGNIHLLPILNSIGLSVTESNFRINTASGTALLEYVRQGLGMSILTQDAQDICPELERVLPELPVIPVPIWIVTHRELRTSRRIRIVFDVLAEEIREQMGT